MRLFGSDAAPTKDLTVQTPDGPITAKTATVDPHPQEIVRVSSEDRERFRRLADSAPAFLATYAGDVSEPTLKDYDRAFAVWQGSESPKHSEEEVIWILGALLGEKLVSNLEMEWVVVADEYGRDFAVRHVRSEVMAFPFSSVKKRVDDKKHDFLFMIFYTVKDRLDSGEYDVRDEG